MGGFQVGSGLPWGLRMLPGIQKRELAGGFPTPFLQGATVKVKGRCSFHPLTRKQIMSGLLFHTAPLVSTFQPPDPGYRSESEEQDSSPSQNCFLCFLQRVLWFGVLFFLEEASGAEERAALGCPPAGGLLRSLASPSLSLPKALEGKRRKKTSSRGFQPIPLCKHPQPPFQKDHSRFRDAPTPPHPV